MINNELQKRILSSIFLVPISFFFIIQGSLAFIFFLSLIFLATSLEWFKMTKNKDLLRIFGLFFFIFFFFYNSLYKTIYWSKFLSICDYSLYFYRYWRLYFWQNI